MAFCLDEERNQAWRRSDHGAAVCAVCCVYLHEIDGQGIRFDVYSEDDSKTVYDCEMQTSRKDNLPKRTRYYQGMIDLNLLERGANYKELKKSYVIFICPFDEFKRGLHKYTFENRCKDMPELVLGDESTKIFLCAGGNADDVSDDMKDFLNWLTTEKIRDSELVKKLQNAVENAQNQFHLGKMIMMYRRIVLLVKRKRSTLKLIHMSIWVILQ